MEKSFGAISLIATPVPADPPDWEGVGGSLFVELGMAIDRTPLVQQVSLPARDLLRVRIEQPPNGVQRAVVHERETNPASAIAPEPQPQAPIVPIRLLNAWENDEW